MCASKSQRNSSIMPENIMFTFREFAQFTLFKSMFKSIFKSMIRKRLFNGTYCFAVYSTKIIQTEISQVESHCSPL